ncbi:hypothetical protein OH76DRAFT_1483364 [Lentinus brumalis]|uniref:DUF6533 domain-containing protein n=1 Tax=Lentinus brumalis TaxID=2498619 RepID=A0A371D9E3_9APHY|nr:hypothetical protein OH76DRAFT_1483364 [Polyporus brumalis]
MSSDAADAAATVALFDSFYTIDYCAVASSVIFIYDALITFDREVAYLWTAKRVGGASLLFLANKWISMTVYVMLLVGFTSFPSDKRFVRSLPKLRLMIIVDIRSCSLFKITAQAMLTLQFIPGAAFSALRAYVLSTSKILGILVATLSLAPVCANLVSYGYQVSGVNSPPLGCVYEDNTTIALDLRFVSFNLITCLVSDSVQGDRIVVIIARVPLIAADILLIYITWTMLRGRAALTHFQQSKRLTLSDVLFRGAAPVAIDNGYGSFVTAFTAPITAILTSRFLLALQEANQTVVRLDPDDPLHSSRNPWDSGTPSFISSLGGFVNPARPARSDDDDGFELEVRSSSNGEEEEGTGQPETPEAAASSSSTA